MHPPRCSEDSMATNETKNFGSSAVGTLAKQSTVSRPVTGLSPARCAGQHSTRTSDLVTLVNKVIYLFFQLEHTRFTHNFSLGKQKLLAQHITYQRTVMV